jgi:hypothetical protein
MDETLFKFPKTRQGNLIKTSVCISEDFYKAARNYNIQFSEAMRQGISLMLAEKGVVDYDNNLNLLRKISLLSKRLEETSKELEELKSKTPEHSYVENEIVSKEVETILTNGSAN